MTLTLVRSSAEQVDSAILQNSVRSAFSSFNWSNRPALQSVQAGERPTLTMSVQQFFGGFAWSASSILPVEPELPPIDRSFTLDDFSDLF